MGRLVDKDGMPLFAEDFCEDKRMDLHLLKLSYRHRQFDPETQQRTKRRGFTECRIETLDRTQAWIGTAWCSRKDRFKKATGREISLRRALRAMGKQSVQWGWDHPTWKVESVWDTEC